ncbi:MAG: glutathione S-transferase, partial [Thermoleophilaceae bacterium]|nr:glutathione S-transferase [Thermoleophilaceae bacterium]
SALPKIPSWLAPAMIKPISQIETRLLGHHGRAGEYLERLPANLDRVDQLIASGVIGGDRPNVADLQIAASVRLLMACDDLREQIDTRPAGALARRLMPEVPGRLPAGALTTG